jgi:hypothetical protein
VHRRSMTMCTTHATQHQHAHATAAARSRSTTPSQAQLAEPGSTPGFKSKPPVPHDRSLLSLVYLSILCSTLTPGTYWGLGQGSRLDTTVHYPPSPPARARAYSSRRSSDRQPHLRTLAIYALRAPASCPTLPSPAQRNLGSGLGPSSGHTRSILRVLATHRLLAPTVRRWDCPRAPDGAGFFAAAARAAAAARGPPRLPSPRLATRPEQARPVRLLAPADAGDKNLRVGRHGQLALDSTRPQQPWAGTGGRAQPRPCQVVWCQIVCGWFEGWLLCIPRAVARAATRRHRRFR